jgi:hypothetical protein
MWETQPPGTFRACSGLLFLYFMRNHLKIVGAIMVVPTPYTGIYAPLPQNSLRPLPLESTDISIHKAFLDVRPLNIY